MPCFPPPPPRIEEPSGADVQRLIRNCRHQERVNPAAIGAVCSRATCLPARRDAILASSVVAPLRSQQSVLQPVPTVAAWRTKLPKVPPCSADASKVCYQGSASGRSHSLDGDPVKVEIGGGPPSAIASTNAADSSVRSTSICGEGSTRGSSPSVSDAACRKDAQRSSMHVETPSDRCEICLQMKARVNILTSALADIGHRLTSWQNKLAIPHICALADLVLECSLPCALIDPSLQAMCASLESLTRRRENEIITSRRRSGSKLLELDIDGQRQRARRKKASRRGDRRSDASQPSSIDNAPSIRACAEPMPERGPHRAVSVAGCDATASMVCGRAEGQATTTHCHASESGQEKSATRSEFTCSPPCSVMAGNIHHGCAEDNLPPQGKDPSCSRRSVANCSIIPFMGNGRQNSGAAEARALGHETHLISQRAVSTDTAERAGNAAVAAASAVAHSLAKSHGPSFCDIQAGWNHSQTPASFESIHESAHSMLLPSTPPRGRRLSRDDARRVFGSLPRAEENCVVEQFSVLDGSWHCSPSRSNGSNGVNVDPDGMLGMEDAMRKADEAVHECTSLRKSRESNEKDSDLYRWSTYHDENRRDALTVEKSISGFQEHARSSEESPPNVPPQTGERSTPRGHTGCFRPLVEGYVGEADVLWKDQWPYPPEGHHARLRRPNPLLEHQKQFVLPFQHYTRQAAQEMQQDHPHCRHHQYYEPRQHHIPERHRLHRQHSHMQELGIAHGNGFFEHDVGNPCFWIQGHGLSDSEVWHGTQHHEAAIERVNFCQNHVMLPGDGSCPITRNAVDYS